MISLLTLNVFSSFVFVLESYCLYFIVSLCVFHFICTYFHCTVHLLAWETVNALVCLVVQSCCISEIVLCIAFLQVTRTIMLSGITSVRPSVRLLSVHTYFSRRDIFVLSRRILMKLATKCYNGGGIHFDGEATRPTCLSCRRARRKCVLGK